MNDILIIFCSIFIVYVPFDRLVIARVFRTSSTAAFGVGPIYKTITNSSQWITVNFHSTLS